MSFSLIVIWYERGAQISLPSARVFAAIGGEMRERYGSFTVRYADGSETWVSCELDPEGGVTSVGIERPSNAPTWDATVRLLNLGNGCCVWPGDAYAVTSLDAVAHLPTDVVSGLGEPHVVRDGAELAAVVATSS